MSIRVALDTDRPAELAVGADAILTYADLYTIELEDYLRSLAPVVAWIDRGQGDVPGVASILDIEPGSFRPGQVAGWLDRKRAARVPYLTTYCDRSDLDAVTADAGSRPHWRMVATLDGTIAIAGLSWADRPALVQCTGEAQLGFHADLSVILRDGWHPHH